MLLFLLPPGISGVVVVVGCPAAVVVVSLEFPDEGAAVVVATGAAGTGGSVRLKQDIYGCLKRRQRKRWAYLDAE